jgi:sugar lactone lactonase YvrE
LQDAIAVDATGLYWATAATGTIMKLETTGGAPKMLADGQAYPLGLAVRSGALFWANRGSTTALGSIVKVSTTSASAGSL